MYFIPLPDDDENPCKLADWLEINSLINPFRPVSYEKLRSDLTSLKTPEKLQDIVSQTSTELDNRSRHLKDAYPFSINATLLRVKDSKLQTFNWAYVFCLIISFIGLEIGQNKLKIWKIKEMSFQFEEICALAAKNYLGNMECDSEVLHFGYPRLLWHENLRPFKKALEHLREQINDGRIRGTSRQRAKDGGLDVVAWNHFPDRRAGKLLLLGQCAASQDKYAEKMHEVKQFLENDIEIQSQRMLAFFIPHALNIEFEEHAQQWMEINSNAGILFDRCRISFFAKNWDDAEFKRKLPISLRHLRSYCKSL